MGGSVSSALRSGKRWLKPLLVAAAAVVILGGSSAAAYYGVVVPNKPTNVLKTALLNSLQQKQVSFKGTLDASSAGTAYKVDLTGAADATTKASDVQLNLTVSGINFAVEARLVDQNLYLKVGDLSTLTTLLGTYSPDLATSAQSLSNAVSNKWVEVDSTLLNEASASCALNTNWSLTNNDAQLLTDQYSKDPFATVQSSTSDTVGGKKVEKFVLSVDDDKLAAYAKNLKGLSLFKTLENCEKGSNPADSFTGDHDHTPLTIWVDKSTKQVVQLASNSTAQDAKTYDIKASGTITLTYGKVNIVAPTGAEPALQIISQIEQSFQASGFDLTSLLSGLLGSAGGAGSSAADSERQADISTLQAQLEAFFALNNYYPSLSDLNSSTWLAANMKDLDKSALADPSNSSSMKLVANPTAKSYAYTVTTDTGNSCESNETTCTMYTLTATLSDGTTFVKQSLN